MSEQPLYREEDLFRLAKRVNNPKRSYLLVNPLQGKHIPVRPTAALAMMGALGARLRAALPGKPLVIGFAETATAIAAAVAREMGEECRLLQTTRENPESVKNWVVFSEEHSHAVEQKLCGDELERTVAACDAILLVDDEISTGKTILNIVAALRRACPAAAEKRFVAASLINRVEESRLPAFRERGISFVSLVHPKNEDYEEKVRDYSVREAGPPREPGESGRREPQIRTLNAELPDPRTGVSMSAYERACRAATEEILAACGELCGLQVLVLGTEEFMFPPLLLAEELERCSGAASVRFHATTRSPIGICAAPDYPITDGVRLHSLYDPERITYLYDLGRYDRVIVFTDAPEPRDSALRELQAALAERGCGELLVFRGGRHV